MTNYLHLPGVSGEYASAPDTAVLSLADTFALQAFVSRGDWSPASRENVLTKWTGPSNKSYRLVIGATALVFIASTDGAAEEEVNVATPAFVDGTAHWISAEFNGGTVQFFDGGTDLAGPSWTQIGTDKTLASITSCFDGSAVLTVGGHNNGDNEPPEMGVYRVRLYDDLTETTTVFDADFTDLSVVSGQDGETFTEDSAQRAIVTIHGTQWIYASVNELRGNIPIPGI